MNAKTFRFFECINAEAKQKFGTKLVKNEKDQFILMLESLLSSRDVTQTQKRKLKYLLDNKLLGKGSKEVVNDEISKEIKKFYDTKIESAIKSGTIPPPDMQEYERTVNRFNSNI